MKRLTTVVLTSLLAGNLSLAQTTSGSAKPTPTPATKSGKSSKGKKGGSTDTADATKKAKKKKKK